MAEDTLSPYIAFFDECGDHSLEKIDRDFPLFVLSTVIVERAVYQDWIVPALARLKMRFWNHEGVNLHSRDIRRARGDFAFMQVPRKREELLAALGELMRGVPITLFITAIHKEEHKQRYGMAASNPYDLALTYTFERVLHFLDGEGETHLPVTAEARGKNEDNQLETAFYRLMTQGTGFIPAARFQRISCIGTLPYSPSFNRLSSVDTARLPAPTLNVKLTKAANWLSFSGTCTLSATILAASS